MDEGKNAHQHGNSWPGTQLRLKHFSRCVSCFLDDAVMLCLFVCLLAYLLACLYACVFMQARLTPFMVACRAGQDNLARWLSSLPETDVHAKSEEVLLLFLLFLHACVEF